jgi:hypothetical protein
VSKRTKILLPAALKHGGYSGIAVLPGEDKDAFEKLHRDLINELKPNGALEDDIVMTIARYVWRKQNLKTYRKAEAAKKWHDQLLTTEIRRRTPPPEIVTRLRRNTADPERTPYLVSKTDVKALYKEVTKQMGEQNLELAFIADQVTTANLHTELELNDRLDCMIDRALKRLLMVRGIKSLAVSSEALPSRTPLLVSTSSCA